MPLVVDASIALAWALPDEFSDYADAVLARVEKEGLHVPELWAREVANGLAMAYRRKRITIEQEQEFLAVISSLAITSDLPTVLQVIRDGTAAARQYGLTAYDAAYLDLALRQGAMIASLDDDLRKAAAQAGVAIFDGSPSTEPRP